MVTRLCTELYKWLPCCTHDCHRQLISDSDVLNRRKTFSDALLCPVSWSKQGKVFSTFCFYTFSIVLSGFAMLIINAWNYLKRAPTLVLLSGYKLPISSIHFHMEIWSLYPYGITTVISCSELKIRWEVLNWSTIPQFRSKISIAVDPKA